MAKVIWSELALNDIKGIHDYIAKDSIDRAALFIERLIPIR
jgi:plasmid stabilization system protein ParE